MRSTGTSEQRTSKPDFLQAWFNLGNVLRDAGRNDEAIHAYEQAVRYGPDYAEAYNNLGSLFQRFGRLPEATAALRQALRSQPNYPRAKNNLGVVLTEERKFDQAVELFHQVIADQPDFVEPYNNLGVALMHRGDLDEALAWVEQALAMQPDSAEAHKNRAVIWLFQGDFARGWPEFEWRWRSKDFPPNPYPQPNWNGRPLPGGTLLLHAEQGLGDTIQFVRFAAEAGRLAGRTILVCPPPLVTLLRRGWAEFGSRATGAPAADRRSEASFAHEPCRSAQGFAAGGLRAPSLLATRCRTGRPLACGARRALRGSQGGHRLAGKPELSGRSIPFGAAGGILAVCRCRRA